MSRLKPTMDVIRGLFARSGNQCAFPDCSHPLVNSKNMFVGQVCHIEAVLPGGQRYNADKSDEERRSYDNLLLLCYAHHIETNDEREWTADRMKAMKRNHEEQCYQSTFTIEESTLREVSDDIEAYWTEIHRLNQEAHVAPPDVVVQIDSHASFDELVESCNSSLDGLSDHHDILRQSDEKLNDDFCGLLRIKGIDPSLFDDIPYYRHPFENRNFLTHAMGLPNTLQRLRVDLILMEIKFLEKCLKSNSGNEEIRSRLLELRAQFAEIAQNEVAVD